MQMGKKTALVTGSSRGLGRALCHELHSRGWAVMATCRNRLDIVPEPFNRTFALDVEDDESIDRMKADIGDVPIDLLINNAGIYVRGHDSLASLDRQTLLHEFNVDAVSPIMVARALEQNLRAACGSIINISSVLGSIGDADEAKSYGYRAAKASLNMLTKTISLEMKDGLNLVVAVHPGLVQTDMINGLREGAQRPEEAAKCIIDTYEKLTAKDTGSFIDRHGNILPF